MHSVGSMGGEKVSYSPPDSTKDPAVRNPLGTSDVLEQTLLIATSATDEQLVSRTLAAACAVTGGVVAAALAPVGERQTHGDSVLAARLVAAARAPLDLRAGGPTTAFAAAGLPSAITMPFGDTLIVVASPEPGRLDTRAGSLLALLVAHAGATRDRLHRARPPGPAGPLRPAHRTARTTGRSRSGSARRSPAGPRCSRSTWTTSRRSMTQYGHQAGDHALLCLVEALRAALRGDDQLYRIGGDEFAVVLEVNGAAEVGHDRPAPAARRPA